MLTAYARRGPGRSTSVPAITLLNTTNAWVFAEDPIKLNATQAIVHLGLAQVERLILTRDENALADTGMIVGFAVSARINSLVARARHVDNLGRFELGLLRGGRGQHGSLQKILKFRRLNVHAHRLDEFLQRQGELRLLDADLSNHRHRDQARISPNHPHTYPMYNTKQNNTNLIKPSVRNCRRGAMTNRHLAAVRH